MHGQTLGNYAYGLWITVVVNVALSFFCALSFVRPKKRVEWRSMGAFLAFLVAMFTAMYGFPLTIYLLTTTRGASYPSLNPFSHPSGHLLLVFPGLANSALAMTVLHVVTNGLVFLGFYLMYLGWRPIHAGAGQALVTEGIYARMRHPQIRRAGVSRHGTADPVAHADGPVDVAHIGGRILSAGEA